MPEAVVITLITIFGGGMLSGIGWLVKTMVDNRTRDRKAEEARVAWEQRLEEDIESLKEDSLYQRDRTAKIEMLQLLQHEPAGSRIVYEKYNKYVAAGHNSYVQDLFESWKELE